MTHASSQYPACNKFTKKTPKKTKDKLTTFKKSIMQNYRPRC